MIDFFKNIFGESVNIKETLANGALLIDVRTQEEYKAGHKQNSINIPLDKLPSGIKKLDRNKVIVTCCASGARSATAKNYLKSQGFEKVYNGGSWRNL